MEDLKTMQVYRIEYGNNANIQAKKISKKMLRLFTQSAVQSDKFLEWKRLVLKQAVRVGNLDYQLEKPFTVYPPLLSMEVMPETDLKTQLRIFQLGSGTSVPENISLNSEELNWIQHFIIDVFIPFLHFLRKFEPNKPDFEIRLYNFLKARNSI
jgi:hypothetical protein